MMSAQRSARPTSRVTPQLAPIQQSKASARTRKPAVGHCMRAILTRRGPIRHKGLQCEPPCWLNLVAGHGADVVVKTNTELLFAAKALDVVLSKSCLCTRCDVLPHLFRYLPVFETGQISS